MVKGFFDKSKGFAGQNPAQHKILNSRFKLNLTSDWQNKTVYTYASLEEDEIKHNILMTIESSIDAPELKEYAEHNIKSLEVMLQEGYHELKRG